jgi:hypothetical protein
MRATAFPAFGSRLLQNSEFCRASVLVTTLIDYYNAKRIVTRDYAVFAVDVQERARRKAAAEAQQTSDRSAGMRNLGTNIRRT